jgi:hypothetical protein
MGKNIPNNQEIYQMSIKYGKWHQNMYTKWTQNIATSSIVRPSKIYPNLKYTIWQPFLFMSIAKVGA